MSLNTKSHVNPSVGGCAIPCRQTDRYNEAKSRLFAISSGFDLKHFKLKKCKAIPLQAWTSHEDSRRLRLPDSKKIGT
jgi:hypothetical protein